MGMGMMLLPKPVKKIRAVLERTGLAYEIKPSEKHYKLFLEDRLIGVMSRSSKESPTGIANLSASIRRSARGHVLNGQAV